MITRNDIERDIDTSQSCATWTYKGKGCGIDPVDGHYVMWYGLVLCQDFGQIKLRFFAF